MPFPDVTQKVGPLPVWAWGGIGGAVIGVGWRVVSSRNKAKEAANAQDSVSTASVTPTQDEGLVDTSGWGSSVYTSGYLPPSTGIDDSTATTSINPATGNPYAVDVALPINPLTGQPYAVDVAVGGIENQTLQNEIDRLTNENEELKNAPPAAVPVPDVVSPVTVAPITTAPSPAPRPTATPAKGTIIWKGENPPNMTTIKNLLKERYGDAAIPTRTVKAGTGQYVVVIA